MDAQTIASLIGLATTITSGLTALVMWAVKRIAKSHDDAATKSCASQDRATDAIIENTKVTTQLVERMSTMHGKIDDLWKRAGGATPIKRTATPHRGVHRMPTSDEE